MTYSHNKFAANRNNAERYAHGASPPNNFFGHGHGGGVHSNRKTNQTRGAWQRSHANNANTLSTSRCVGSGNAILSSQPVSSSISSPVSNVPSRAGGGRNSGNKSNNHHQQRTNSVQALNGVGPVFGLFGRTSPISSLPTITHFAGSKCFDAPAPTALPKPPQHWTATIGGAFAAAPVPAPAPPSEQPSGRRSQVMKSARRSLMDDFGTHNLKLLLNVQS